jgi:hypothetical protein
MSIISTVETAEGFVTGKAWVKPFLAGIAAILAFGFVLWGLHRLYEDVKQSGRNEIQAQWDAEKTGQAKVQGDFQGALTGALHPMFDQLSAEIGAIKAKGAEINVKLPQAIAADPRYRDPACTLTPDALAQVNAARALSASVTK